MLSSSLVVLNDLKDGNAKGEDKGLDHEDRKLVAPKDESLQGCHISYEDQRVREKDVRDSCSEQRFMEAEVNPVEDSLVVWFRKIPTGEQSQELVIVKQ